MIASTSLPLPSLPMTNQVANKQPPAKITRRITIKRRINLAKDYNWQLNKHKGEAAISAYIDQVRKLYEKETYTERILREKNQFELDVEDSQPDRVRRRKTIAGGRKSTPVLTSRLRKAKETAWNPIPLPTIECTYLAYDNTKASNPLPYDEFRFESPEEMRQSMEHNIFWLTERTPPKPVPPPITTTIVQVIKTDDEESEGEQEKSQSMDSEPTLSGNSQAMVLYTGAHPAPLMIGPAKEERMALDEEKPAVQPIVVKDMGFGFQLLSKPVTIKPIIKPATIKPVIIKEEPAETPDGAMVWIGNVPLSQPTVKPSRPTRGRGRGRPRGLGRGCGHVRASPVRELSSQSSAALEMVPYVSRLPTVLDPGTRVNYTSGPMKVHVRIQPPFDRNYTPTGPGVCAIQ